MNPQEILLSVMIFTAFIVLAIFLQKFVIYLLLKKFKKFQYQQVNIPKNLKRRLPKFVLEQELIRVGEIYKNIDVERIILIHGTFVGNDPFYLNEIMKEKTSNKFHPILNTFRIASKKTLDFLGKDKGNFTNNHIKLLEKYLRQKSSLFHWSGSNTHLARLRGAIQLIEKLNEYAQSGESNFLIMAHSHGGQILALLTQFFHSSKLIKNLIEKELVDDELKEKIQNIKRLKFTFVTMGMPVRYRWVLSPNVSILHLINHRGRLPVGGSLIGSFWTNKGDYIQQTGGAGSDYFPLIDVKRRINIDLGALFGERSESVFKMLKKRQRLHHQGMNFLIDYRDSRFYPNFYTSAFGHGVYTRFDLLPYHLELIKDYLIK